MAKQKLNLLQFAPRNCGTFGRKYAEVVLTDSQKLQPALRPFKLEPIHLSNSTARDRSLTRCHPLHFQSLE
jgi:hypothetical protein